MKKLYLKIVTETLQKRKYLTAKKKRSTMH